MISSVLHSLHHRNAILIPPSMPTMDSHPVFVSKLSHTERKVPGTQEYLKLSLIAASMHSTPAHPRAKNCPSTGIPIALVYNVCCTCGARRK